MAYQPLVSGKDARRLVYGFHAKSQIQARHVYVNLRDNRVDEIYAYGFRNPYHFSFDKLLGRLIWAFPSMALAKMLMVNYTYEATAPAPHLVKLV